MKVENIEEKEDGNCFVKLDLSPEELTYLVQEGFITMLKRYLDDLEQQKKVPALCKKDLAPWEEPQ